MGIGINTLTTLIPIVATTSSICCISEKISVDSLKSRYDDLTYY